MSTKLWITTVDKALEFYEKCLYKEAVKLEEKEAILKDMDIEALSVEADTEEVKQALAQEFNVVSVRRKHNGPSARKAK